MIRQFKNGYYTERSEDNVRKGDLLAVGGVVGVLRSDYDPDFIQLEAEGGSLHTFAGDAGVMKLRPVERTSHVRGYVYPRSQQD